MSESEHSSETPQGISDLSPATVSDITRRYFGDDSGAKEPTERGKEKRWARRIRIRRSRDEEDDIIEDMFRGARERQVQTNSAISEGNRFLVALCTANLGFVTALDEATKNTLGNQGEVMDIQLGMGPRVEDISVGLAVALDAFDTETCGRVLGAITKMSPGDVDKERSRLEELFATELKGNSYGRALRLPRLPLHTPNLTQLRDRFVGSSPEVNEDRANGFAIGYDLITRLDLSGPSLVEQLHPQSPKS